MTKLFEQAVETARTLSPERQDEIARLVLMLAQEDEPVYPLSPEEDSEILQALAEVDRDDLLGEGALRQVLSKFSR
ncbi:hypothetical protein AAIH46_01940 [Rhizobium sp. 0TCS1.26]|uniref:hypothetical protein n=1 Tax=Rhizobium sp. 0TCS1.26 TaxID=3142623 RepID=UPI003D2E003B